MLTYSKTPGLWSALTCSRMSCFTDHRWDIRCQLKLACCSTPDLELASQEAGAPGIAEDVSHRHAQRQLRRSTAARRKGINDVCQARPAAPPAITGDNPLAACSMIREAPCQAGRGQAARRPHESRHVHQDFLTSSYQAASRSSVGGDTRFWPDGAAAGSHCTIESLKPQLRRNGPSTDLHTPPTAIHSPFLAIQWQPSHDADQAIVGPPSSCANVTHRMRSSSRM